MALVSTIEVSPNSIMPGTPEVRKMENGMVQFVPSRPNSPRFQTIPGRSKTKGSYRRDIAQKLCVLLYFIISAVSIAVIVWIIVSYSIWALKTPETPKL